MTLSWDAQRVACREGRCDCLGYEPGAEEPPTWMIEQAVGRLFKPRLGRKSSPEARARVARLAAGQLDPPPPELVETRAEALLMERARWRDGRRHRRRINGGKWAELVHPLIMNIEEVPWWI